MSDIVERLTALSEEYRDHDPDVVAFTAEAATEITRLRADRASAQEREQRMREALEPFAQFADAHVDEDGWSAGRMGERICDWFGPSEFRDARAALGEPQ